MYQELSRKEKVSTLALILYVLIGAFALTMINVLLVRLGLNSGFTDIFIIVCSVIGIHLLIKKNLISYKYCIIEDELIFHEVIGTKEKRVFNLNISQIEAFGPAKGEAFEKGKQATYASKKRLYNCANKPNRYYVVFNDEGEKRWFTFQPSDHMLSLIQQKM